MFKNLIRLSKSFATPVSSNAFATTSFRNKAPVRVTITGASDRVGYSTIFRIANGDMLGKDQPVIIQLFDTPDSQEALEGLAMELRDCAFPLLNDVTFSDKYTASFKDTDYALIISSKSRGRDFAKEEAQTFIDIGKAINDNSSRDIKVVVGGYPANRNCLITSHYAKEIPKENFTAMTRLGHNRALSQLANKTQSNVNDIDKLAIWGSQAPTMFPDLTYTTVKGKVASFFPDREWRCDRGQSIDILPSLDASGWIKKEFIHKVRDRDFHYIQAKTPKAAASVGSSLIDHMRDWVLGTNGKWTSMAVHSDGSYGIEPGFIFSYPVTCENGKYEIVKGLEIEPEMFQISKEFLLWERQPIEDLLV